MAQPQTMKAIKTDGNENASLHENVPVPTPPPGYILVKTSNVALNPTDWKHIKLSKLAGHTVGCDYAGTVVAAGSNIAKDWSLGDRVAGFAHGVKSNNPHTGAFAEYIIAKSDVQLRVPPNISLAEASTLGVGVVTVGQGLYQHLGLPLPSNASATNTPLLIYGGSTATGILAIQWAKLSGLRVITTCSPRNFEFVKKLGADAAFSYADREACAKQIREYTNNSLEHAFDCHGDGDAPWICANALTTRSTGRYVTIMPNGQQEFPRDDVALKTWHLGYTVAGEEFEFPLGSGRIFPASQEDFDFGKKIMTIAEELLKEGKFRGQPTVREGGLAGVFSGLDDLREGRVSGQKLVYEVA